MIAIAICEDEKSFANALEKKVKIWAAQKGMNVKVVKYSDGTEIVEDKQNDQVFDMIFMDIEMKEMNGLEAAQKIRKENLMTEIVFISQYEDYYKEAYSVHPFHFLSKPICQEQVDKVMDDYIAMTKQDRDTFTYALNKTHYTVRLDEILYFNSVGRQVTILFIDGSTRTYYDKLYDLEKRLADKNCRFMRVHQSYLVNVRYVTEYRYSALSLINGERIMVSRDKRTQMRQIHKLQLGK